MTAFFVVFYLAIRFRWTALEPAGWEAFRASGLVLMVLGAAFNVWGRVYLKTNWSDHVRIYGDQTLITTGPYRLVRHPLYASLIWMFYGAAIAYLNPLAAVATTVIFIPAMVYRSNLEELALRQTFGAAYLDYKNATGRFVPRFARQSRSTRRT